MTNIFLLEFIVDDLCTWCHPENVIESDESCVNFSFFNNTMSICEKEFGFASGKYGKNCLFTLDKTPESDKQIAIEVFKKPFEQQCTSIGHGIIPLYQTFQSTFDLVFGKKQNDFDRISKRISYDEEVLAQNELSSGNSRKPSKRLSGGLSDSALVNSKSVLSKSISGNKTDRNSKSESKKLPDDENSAPKKTQSEPSKHSADNLEDEKGTIPVQLKIEEDNVSNKSKAFHENEQINFEQDNTSQTESGGGETKSERLRAGGGSVDSKRESVDSTKSTKYTYSNDIKINFPISEMNKALYPVLNSTGTQVGVICILLRITCFGNSVVSPFFQSTKNDNFILQNENGDEGYIYSKLAEISDSKRNKPLLTCNEIFPTKTKNSTRSEMQKSSKMSSKQKKNYFCSDGSNGKHVENNLTIKKREIPGKLPNVNCNGHEDLKKSIEPIKDKADYENPLPQRDCDCIDFGRNNVRQLQKLSEKSNMPINDCDLDVLGKTDQAKDKTCVCPPSSVLDMNTQNDIEFDEFMAEMDDNALIVRVPKNEKIVTQIDEDDLKGIKEKKEKLYFHCAEDGDNITVQLPEYRARVLNTTGIPKIKGNLKYPSYYQANFQIPDYDNIADSYQVKPSKSKNCCSDCFNDRNESYGTNELTQNHPPEVEVCKKGSLNPKTDVFIIKIGPRGQGRIPSRQMELEVHTPKSPNAPKYRETRAAQTYEEEFSEPHEPKKESKKGVGKEDKKKKKKK